MTGFFKNEDCPSSNELLEYQSGDLAKDRSGEITRHLSACEFCESEVEFYSTYPLAAEESAPEVSEIPGPLFELAEALLKKHHAQGASLNELLKDKRSLISDKV